MTALTIASIVIVLFTGYVLVSGRVPGSRRRNSFTRAEEPKRYWIYVGQMLLFAVITYFAGSYFGM